MYDRIMFDELDCQNHIVISNWMATWPDLTRLTCFFETGGNISLINPIGQYILVPFHVHSCILHPALTKLANEEFTRTTYFTSYLFESIWEHFGVGFKCSRGWSGYNLPTFINTMLCSCKDFPHHAGMDTDRPPGVMMIESES